MSDNPFEIPQSIRDMAEQNMQQARAAYDHLSDFVTQSMHTWMDAIPQSPVSAGFKDVQDQTMDFAKNNAESAFSFAAKICRAQNPQELLAIQTQFAQDRMQALAMHTQELCGLIGQSFEKLQRS